MDNNEAKLKALQMAVSAVEKQWGKGSIMRMDQKPIEAIPVVSTGIPSLDIALGVGGIPRSRITEVFGAEGAGKTSICLHVAAQAIKQGGQVAFIDAEHALDMAYAQKLGVDPSKLLLSQPDFGEQALSVVETLLSSHALDVIIVDSVAALTPQSEIEGEMGDPSMGTHARLMSQALRKLTAVIGKSPTCMMFTNQMRDNIKMSQWARGPDQVTTGGNALKFYASVRLDVRRTEQIKDGEQPIGDKVRVKVVKNKVAPPFKECILENIWGVGFASTDTLMDDAIKVGVVVMKGGGWFDLDDGTRICQGRPALKTLLKEDAQWRGVIEEKVKAAAARPVMVMPPGSLSGPATQS